MIHIKEYFKLDDSYNGEVITNINQMKAMVEAFYEGLLGSSTEPREVTQVVYDHDSVLKSEKGRLFCYQLKMRLWLLCWVFLMQKLQLLWV